MNAKDEALHESAAPRVKVLRPKQAALRVGIGLSTLYFWINPRHKHYDPSFPKPFPIGGPNSRAVGFDAAELDAYVDRRAAAARQVA